MDVLRVVSTVRLVRWARTRKISVVGNTLGGAGQVLDVSTLQSQREERFRALFADAYGDVLRFAQRRVHVSYAEDVAAEAFLVAWRRLDDAPSRIGDLRAWLFGITRNCLLNARRGQDRASALAVRLAQSPTPQPFGGALDPELISRRIDLAASWMRLSQGDQEVLALTVFDDLTSPQAARVIGISPAAYRLRLMRARRELRRNLDLTDAACAFAIQESR
ncbi:MAG: RNA polymerase sigma factor [Cellulomonas sp.]